MSTNFLIVLSFISCMLKTEKNKVDIFIDTQKHGWYFIEIKQDSLREEEDVIKITIDNTMHLQKIITKNYDNLIFDVFDKAGIKVSNKMKLSSILFSDDKRIFFKFYNPSEEDLARIKDWLPTNPEYLNIINKSKRQLSEMLAK